MGEKRAVNRGVGEGSEISKLFMYLVIVMLSNPFLM